MAEYNVRINVKNDTGYDQLYPESKSDIINFDKSNSDLSSTNAETAIKEVNTKANTNKTNIGTLSSLTTDSKTNLVGAINEVNTHADTAQSTANTNKTNIGTLSNLKTSVKTSIVNSINDLYDNVVHKSNVIDDPNDLLANQADGMVAGAKAVVGAFSKILFLERFTVATSSYNYECFVFRINGKKIAVVYGTWSGKTIQSSTVGDFSVWHITNLNVTPDDSRLDGEHMIALQYRAISGGGGILFVGNYEGLAVNMGVNAHRFQVGHLYTIVTSPPRTAKIGWTAIMECYE